jgi:hypothetical protein
MERPSKAVITRKIKKLLRLKKIGDYPGWDTKGDKFRNFVRDSVWEAMKDDWENVDEIVANPEFTFHSTRDRINDKWEARTSGTESKGQTEEETAAEQTQIEESLTDLPVVFPEEDEEKEPDDPPGRLEEGFQVANIVDEEGDDLIENIMNRGIGRLPIAAAEAFLQRPEVQQMGRFFGDAQDTANFIMTLGQDQLARINAFDVANPDLNQFVELIGGFVGLGKAVADVIPPPQDEELPVAVDVQPVPGVSPVPGVDADVENDGRDFKELSIMDMLDSEKGAVANVPEGRGPIKEDDTWNQSGMVEGSIWKPLKKDNRVGKITRHHFRTPAHIHDPSILELQDPPPGKVSRKGYESVNDAANPRLFDSYHNTNMNAEWTPQPQDIWDRVRLNVLGQGKLPAIQGMDFNGSPSQGYVFGY